MSRNTRGNKEYTRLQEIVNENKRLKKEMGSLRRQLAKLDLDRHGYVRDIIEEHYAKEEQEETTEKMLKRLKEEWRCKVCSDGYLEVFTFNKGQETWYRRECNGCNHTTKSQRYDPDKVRGIIKNDPKLSK